MHLHRVRTRLLSSLVAVATAGLIPVLGAHTAYAADPPTPAGLTSAIEPLAAYVPASSCDAQAKPGATSLGRLLTSTYAGTSFSITRPCGADALSTSEHYDGRAVDWMVDATQKPLAESFLTWLFATDSFGNSYANARRLGVMYVIWDNRIWGAYSPGAWTAYSTCAQHPEAAWDTTCHRNHVHLSLSWEGAMGRTSYWTSAVAERDYGPCRVPELNWAAPYSSPNPAPCPTYAKAQPAADASALMRTLVDYSGMFVQSGSSGPVVSAVQQLVGATVDGAFGPATRAALVAWQEAHGVPGTGVTDVPTWRAIVRAADPAPSRGGGRTPLGPVGFDADGHSDLLARTGGGDLLLYSGNGSGGWAAPGRVIGRGWNVFNAMLSPGDFTGDTHPDVLARKPNGDLLLYRGNGTGGWSTGGQVIGRGWNIFDAVLSPGDFNGDGFTDVLARKPNGDLLLYPGNGTGGWATGGQVIGRGWGMFREILSPGDFTGDGNTDLLARTPAGSLYLYAGNGRGGFAAAGRVIGRGWNMYTQVLSSGDFDGDGKADVFGRTPGGALNLYSGNGSGGWASGARRVGAGWHIFTAVVGVG